MFEFLDPSKIDLQDQLLPFKPSLRCKDNASAVFPSIQVSIFSCGGIAIWVVWETAPQPILELGQTHVNGWSRVIASQNDGSTDYIFPFRLRILQWSRHLIIGINKKTKIEKFLILLICK